MDDLFRKAGELYPLKTSGSDWDGVLGKLREDISGVTGSQPGLHAQENRNKRRWLLLLLLIPIGISSLVYFSGSGVKSLNSQLTNTTKDQKTNTKTPAEKNPENAFAQTPPATGHQAPDQTQAAHDIPAAPPVSSVRNRSPDQLNRTETHRNMAGNRNNNALILSGVLASADAGNSSMSVHTPGATNPELFREPVEKTVSLSVYGSGEKPSVYGMPLPPLVATSTTLKTASNESSAKMKTEKTNSSKGIYAVLLGGPDLSTVAFQSTSQAGYSLGVLLGYRFNKRLAVETGLLWDKKYYYSNGEYFDKNKLYNFPSNEKILSVDGNCNMFEIPINLRYDFATRNHHGFFVTAGLSSYLMKKEYYSYEAGITTPTWSGDSTYMNASNNLFSILQISGGYEYSIGKNTKIRIEPYLKIPLQGIGISSMPISSAGLYFGISHSFH